MLVGYGNVDSTASRAVDGLGRREDGGGGGRGGGDGSGS